MAVTIELIVEFVAGGVVSRIAVKVGADVGYGVEVAVAVGVGVGIGVALFSPKLFSIFEVLPSNISL